MSGEDVPDPATGLTNREKNIVRETWSIIKQDVRGNGTDLFVRYDSLINIHFISLLLVSIALEIFRYNFIPSFPRDREKVPKSSLIKNCSFILKHYFSQQRERIVDVILYS